MADALPSFLKGATLAVTAEVDSNYRTPRQPSHHSLGATMVLGDAEWTAEAINGLGRLILLFLSHTGED